MIKRKLCLTLMLLVIGSCSARRDELVGSHIDTSSGKLANGEVVFMKHCHHCHPGGDAGLGPAINNKPIPSIVMKLQVREGLGAMPEFSEHEICSDDLRDLVEYLRMLRNS